MMSSSNVKKKAVPARSGRRGLPAEAENADPPTKAKTTAKRPARGVKKGKK